MSPRADADPGLIPDRLRPGRVSGQPPPPQSQGIPMKCFAQALDLKNDPTVIAAYQEHHRQVWPEVTAALRRIGIVRMRIFLLGHHLFMYYEAPDAFIPERDYQSYAKDARCA